MDHTVVFHVDGPVLVANSENLNQVSRSGFWFALEWKKIKQNKETAHAQGTPETLFEDQLQVSLKTLRFVTSQKPRLRKLSSHKRPKDLSPSCCPSHY